MKLYTLLLLTISCNVAWSQMVPFNNHGIYERKQISDSAKRYYRYVGNLNGNCTGTLVGPKHILTAAHCLYNYNAQNWHRITEFSPAMTGPEDLPFGSANIKKVYVLDEYKRTGEVEYDYAIAELDRELGNELGWLKVATNNSDINSGLITIAGYPGDKDFGTMWSVSCPAAEDNKVLRYKCDTAGGMSGSAIVTIDSESNTPSIIGIHTDGGINDNFGVRINKTVLTDIYNWINNDLIEDAVNNFYDYCLSGDVDRVRIALESKRIFINQKFGKNSWTALAGAAYAGQAQVVELLLSWPFVQVNKGAPLALAVKSQSLETVRILLNNQKIDHNATTYGETALWYAVEAGNFEIVQLLLNSPRVNKEKLGKSRLTPLQLAIQNNNQAIVGLLEQ